jgi:tyrosyl-DNA phosphodiesterase-1
MDMSNNDGDMEEAIQQSLQQLKQDLEQQEKEKEELRQAIALSLGKPVDKLTARETLALTLDSGVKRSSDGQSCSSEQSKKQKQEGMLTYPDGQIKLTHVKGFSGADYITVDQVIEAKYLKKAVMTAFVVDMNFVEEKFPSDINLCIVMHDRPVNMMIQLAHF